MSAGLALGNLKNSGSIHTWPRPPKIKLPVGRQCGSNPFHQSRGPLAAILPLFPRRPPLPIPLGVGNWGNWGKLGETGDMSNEVGRVKSDSVRFLILV